MRKEEESEGTTGVEDAKQSSHLPLLHVHTTHPDPPPPPPPPPSPQRISSCLSWASALRAGLRKLGSSVDRQDQPVDAVDVAVLSDLVHHAANISEDSKEGNERGRGEERR